MVHCSGETPARAMVHCPGEAPARALTCRNTMGSAVGAEAPKFDSMKFQDIKVDLTMMTGTCYNSRMENTPLRAGATGKAC